MYNVLYTNSTSESVLMDDVNSLSSGASVLDLLLSFEESMDGAFDLPGLRLGFKVIIGRLFLDDFDG